jgi:hypothetical protein
MVTPSREGSPMEEEVESPKRGPPMPQCGTARRSSSISPVVRAQLALRLGLLIVLVAAFEEWDTYSNMLARIAACLYGATFGNRPCHAVNAEWL